jgi:hypothetical protein
MVQPTEENWYRDWLVRELARKQRLAGGRPQTGPPVAAQAAGDPNLAVRFARGVPGFFGRLKESFVPTTSSEALQYPAEFATAAGKSWLRRKRAERARIKKAPSLGQALTGEVKELFVPTTPQERGKTPGARLGQALMGVVPATGIEAGLTAFAAPIGRAAAPVGKAVLAADPLATKVFPGLAKVQEAAKATTTAGFRAEQKQIDKLGRLLGEAGGKAEDISKVLRKKAAALKKQREQAAGRMAAQQTRPGLDWTQKAAEARRLRGAGGVDETDFFGPLGKPPPVPSFTPVEDLMSVTGMRLINRRLATSYKGRPYDWTRATDGLQELLSGHVPNRSTLALLEEGLGLNLVKTVLAKRTGWEKASEFLLEVWNIPRAIHASYDISSTLRQGGLFAVAGRKQWVNALKAQAKAARSQKGAEAVEDGIAADPNFPLAVQSKLDLTLQKFRAGRGFEAIEEPFIGGRLASKIPILGKGIQISDRAYTAMINKLRMDMFSAEIARNPGMIGNPQALADLARSINVLSGRGSLGPMTPNQAAFINGAFFGPRWRLSRFQLPGLMIPRPRHDKAVAKMAAKQLVSYTGSVLGLLSLGEVTGKWTVEKDPRSSDFLKIKIGKTRIDPWAGMQQPAVLVARMMTHKIKTLSDKEVRDADPRETLGRYLEYGAHPSLSLYLAERRGETIMGEKLTAGVRLKNFAPIFWQEVLESVGEYGPVKGGALAALPFVGVSTATFDPRRGRGATRPPSDVMPSGVGPSDVMPSRGRRR